MQKKKRSSRSWKKWGLWAGVAFGGCIIISLFMQAVGLIPSTEERHQTETAEVVTRVANLPTLAEADLVETPSFEEEQPSNTPEPPNEIAFNFQEAQIHTNVEGRDEGVYIAILAMLDNQTDGRKCVYARDIRLYLDGTEYEPDNGLQDDLKPIIGRDFMGAYNGQCVEEGQSAETFAAFKVQNTPWDGAELRFKDDSLVIDLMMPVEVAAIFYTDTPAPTNTPSTTPSITPTRPSSTPSNTPKPTNTLPPSNTPMPSATATIELPPQKTLYVQDGDTRARSCPRLNNTDCPVQATLSAGTQVIGIQPVEGESFRSSTVWWQVDYNGQTLYIHSALLADSLPPTPRPSSNTGSTGSTGSQQIQRPSNCSTAVAMGLSPEQAAQWSHLDKDNDGVACYGD